ncbi:hypothetical protein FKM82_004242 [Ascaphus truei]
MGKIVIYGNPSFSLLINSTVKQTFLFLPYKHNTILCTTQCILLPLTIRTDPISTNTHLSFSSTLHSSSRELFPILPSCLHLYRILCSLGRFPFTHNYRCSKT